MNKLLNIGENLMTWASWIAGSMLFGSAVLIAVEVTLRKGFSISMGGADEISSYAMAISCSWAFGFALFRKAHIRVDVLYVRMPKSVRYVLDILSLVFFGIYMVVLTYYAYGVLSTTITRHSVANTPLATPLWIPQGLWFIGLCSFTLTILLLLVGTLYFMAKGDFDRALQLTGASTLEEEIEEETAAVAGQGGVQ